jgi:hypothetical protein
MAQVVKHLPKKNNAQSTNKQKRSLKIIVSQNVLGCFFSGILRPKWDDEQKISDPVLILSWYLLKMNLSEVATSGK